MSHPARVPNEIIGGEIIGGRPSGARLVWRRAMLDRFAERTIKGTVQVIETPGAAPFPESQ